MPLKTGKGGGADHYIEEGITGEEQVDARPYVELDPYDIRFVNTSDPTPRSGRLGDSISLEALNG